MNENVPSFPALAVPEQQQFTIGLDRGAFMVTTSKWTVNRGRP